MNQTLKKSLAIATLLVFGTGMAQAPAQATELPTAAAIQTIWDGAEKAYTLNGTTYAPVRDICNTLQCELVWASEGNQNKLVFTGHDGVQGQVKLDAANQLAMTQNGSYYYDMQEGRIALPASFYEDVIGNVSLQYNPDTKVLAVQLIDNAQGIHFLHMDTYVDETPVEPVVAAAPEPTLTYLESGQASWYGAGLHGNLTSSGEPFNMYDLTAAHKTLAFGTQVKVTNQNTGQSVVVRINDRGPFAHGRVIDLSMAAADQVGMVSSGVAPVSLEIIG